jgi:electron transfer flavoprotein alpha subunit
MKILAIAEQRAGKLKAGAFEALTVAHKLNSNPAEVAAVLVGNGITGLAGELQGYGANKIYTVDAPALKEYNCLGYAAAIEAAIKAFNPDLVIGSASPLGKDILPRLAARLDAGILTDLVEISADGSAINGVKPMYSGKVLAKVSMSASGLKMAAVRLNVFQANKSGQGSATPEALVFTAPESRLTTKEIRKGSSEKPDLTEASFIISGGRALGSADNFKVLHECADVIGATVGASRAAVDSGFAKHDMQVGQTGKTVNPNLYIACGISGSVQHMAGMRTSKVIVAVNTDPEAPIFAIADYGIVADLFEAMPIMTKKFKEIL